jgi:hypothetical protein
MKTNILIFVSRSRQTSKKTIFTDFFVTHEKLDHRKQFKKEIKILCS